MTKQLWANPHSPAALEASPIHMGKVCWHTELHVAISNKIMLCTCKVDPIFLHLVIVFQVFLSKETLNNLYTLKYLPN